MVLPINLPLQDGRFTDDEFFNFCQMNPKLRIERDEHGQIYINMPTGLETSFRNSDLITEVNLWNRQTRLGRVSEANGGYTLPDTSMRAPDVAWVSNERLATVSKEDLKKFARVCPDFVIELASESDELVHLQKKMEKYLLNGVRLAWLIDPSTTQTLVYQPEQAIESVPFDQPLTGKDVLPGFVLTVNDLISE